MPRTVLGSLEKLRRAGRKVPVFEESVSYWRVRAYLWEVIVKRFEVIDC